MPDAAPWGSSRTFQSLNDQGTWITAASATELSPNVPLKQVHITQGYHSSCHMLVHGMLQTTREQQFHSAASASLQEEQGLGLTPSLLSTNQRRAETALQCCVDLPHSPGASPSHTSGDPTRSQGRMVLRTAFFLILAAFCIL